MRTRMRIRMRVAAVAALGLSVVVPTQGASADPDYRCVDDAKYDAVTVGMSLGQMYKQIDSISYAEMWVNEGGWVRAAYLGCGIDTVARFNFKHTSGVPGWYLVDKEWITGTAITRPGQLEMRDADGGWTGCWLRQLPVNPTAAPSTGPYAGTAGWRRVPFDISCVDERPGAVRAAAQFTTLDDVGARDELYRFPKVGLREVDREPGVTTYAGKKALNPCLLRSDGRMHPPDQDRPWLLPVGSHTLLFGAFAGVNAVAGDGHPYTTVVEERVSVTCTAARRPLR